MKPYKEFILEIAGSATYDYKVGDKVIIKSFDGWGRESERIAKVEKVTKKFVWAGGMKFQKKKGGYTSGQTSKGSSGRQGTTINKIYPKQ